MDHLGHTRSLTIFKCSDFPCLSFSMSQISKELKKKIRKVWMWNWLVESLERIRGLRLSKCSHSPLTKILILSKGKNETKVWGASKTFKRFAFSINLKLKVKVNLKPGAHQRGWDSKSESGDPSSREAGPPAYQEYLRWGKYSWKLPVNRMGQC